ncbi:MAG: hypothetical protein AB1489_14730 [Acidobacteriota bacterium]
MRYCLSLLLLSILLLLPACSMMRMPATAYPSDEDVKQVIDNVLMSKKVVKDKVKVKNLENKQAKKDPNNKAYQVSYDVNFDYLDNYFNDFDYVRGSEVKLDLSEYCRLNMFIPWAKKGVVTKVKCDLSFERTVFGWKGPDGNTYRGTETN